MTTWNLVEQIGADTGMDLAAYFVAGLPATVGAITALVIAVRSLRHNAEIREQVSNDHVTNLRDDLDSMASTLSTIDERTRRIGDDQRREVRARRDADRRHGDRLALIDERLDRQDRIADKHHPGEV